MSEEAERMKMVDDVADFYNGVVAIDRLAADSAAPDPAIPAQMAAFTAAYEKLAALHARGKAEAGPVDFSAEQVERVRLLAALVAPGLPMDAARLAEIRALAARCAEGIRGQASPGAP